MDLRKLGKAGWTPRERVHLWFSIAVNHDLVPQAEELLVSLRRVISDQDCRPDEVTAEWSLPAG